MGQIMRLADIIGGFLVFLLGLFLIFLSSQLNYYSEFGPGPGFLPLWVGIFTAVCAIGVIIKALKRDQKLEQFFKPRTRLGLQVLITIIITFLLLPLFGFAIGLSLFIGFTMRMIGKHRWAICLITAFITAIGIHFIFVSWLTIPLPRGLIGF